jgi:2-deoxy-D-gluconate 3-dehydrogenase
MNETIRQLFDLTGRVALVTGVSRGLGRAMAIGLAGAGADIIGISLQEPIETRKQIEAFGKNFYYFHADLAEAEKIPELARQAIAVYGKVDILVNNAGIIGLYPAEEYPLENFDQVFAVNVRGLFLLTQEIGKSMLDRGYGRIIATCSIQSLISGINDSAYVASKHAVAGLVKAFAAEWGGRGVNVNGIAPGFMVTDNTANLRKNSDAVAEITARVPLHRWGQPEDLMGPVIFLASEASRYVNGQLLVVDGGYVIA